MPPRCGPAAFSTPWSDKCLLLISTKCTCKFTRVFCQLRSKMVSVLELSPVSLSASVMLILGLSPLLLELGALSALLFLDRH